MDRTVREAEREVVAGFKVTELAKESRVGGNRRRAARLDDEGDLCVRGRQAPTPADLSMSGTCGGPLTQWGFGAPDS